MKVSFCTVILAALVLVFSLSVANPAQRTLVSAQAGSTDAGFAELGSALDEIQDQLGALAINCGRSYVPFKVEVPGGGP